VQSVAQIGRPSVGHATAAGKVALAFGRDSLPGPPLRRYTSRTIVDSDALAREIRQVASQGWAEAIGEREDDLNAIAAPVRDAGGELVAVLGVQGPASRFDEEQMREGQGALLAAAAGLSTALGWDQRDRA
jgi:IclR family acetate operon transcriptional repressor